MSESLKNKSSKELEGSLKATKVISTALLVVVTLLISITIFGLIFKDNNSTFLPLLVVGISCSAILPLQFATMKKIKTELKSREKK
ncbi:MAG: hypothetical protein WAO74_03545 [Polaribacter sp.]|uniref:hypothetical protein n=1 Tax=Polaribacter sp. TaxID=1920175 RepID=UPI003BB21954